MRPFNWSIAGIETIAASMSAALSNVPGAVRSSVASRTKHENGAVSTLSCGFRLDLPVAVSVIGDKGRVEILDDFHHPQRVQLVLDDVTEIFECPSIGQGYAHEAIEAHERILGGSRQSAIWSADRTLACAKILQAMP